MIRVEPGSTPGIGNTITEHFFFVFYAMFFCLLQGELVGCSSGVEFFFDIATTYMYLQILGFGD